MDFAKCTPKGMLTAHFTHDTPFCWNNDNAKSITHNLPDDPKDHTIMLTMQNTKWLFDHFGFFGKVVATYWDGSKQVRGVTFILRRQALI